jgi:hypothetical protein
MTQVLQLMAISSSKSDRAEFNTSSTACFNIVRRSNILQLASSSLVLATFELAFEHLDAGAYLHVVEKTDSRDHRNFHISWTALVKGT